MSRPSDPQTSYAVLSYVKLKVIFLFYFLFYFILFIYLYILFSSLYRAIEQDTEVIRPTICTRVQIVGLIS